jgi:hypothetical protein
MEVTAVLHGVRTEQPVLESSSSIDDARQAVREDIERHPDRRN